MKKTQSLLCLVAIAAGIMLINSCGKDPQAVTPSLPGNEFLTTVILKLQNTANPSEIDTCVWRQLNPNGNGPVDTSHNTLTLHANSKYTCQLIILDQTQTPVDTVSKEILARENYHLIFYQPTPISPDSLLISYLANPNDRTSIVHASSTDIPGTVTSPIGPWLNLHISRTDLDTNNPSMGIGLRTDFSTGAASTGRLRVVQRHQPNAKDGTYTPGSSDFDIGYKVVIN